MTTRAARLRTPSADPDSVRQRVPSHHRRVLPLLAVCVVAITVPVVVAAAPVAHAAGIAGMTVFIDPGHSGRYDASLTKPVDDGRGGTKNCQTSGTSTNDGYPEHTFNWDVATRVQADLQKDGVRTQLSRPDDASLGPCVDQRAAAANALHADADVSIHADGAAAFGHGFHVNYSAPPVNDVQRGPSMQLATTMRDALSVAGLQPSTYIGSNGLYGRADLSGLNLAAVPAVLVEAGNMRNADEAAQMESPDGRQRYADAITSGIVAFLTQRARG